MSSKIRTEKIRTVVAGLKVEEYPVCDNPVLKDFAELDSLQTKLSEIWADRFSEGEILNALNSGIKLGSRILAAKSVNTPELKAARKLKAQNVEASDCIKLVKNIINKGKCSQDEALSMVLENVKNASVQTLVLAAFTKE